MGDERHLRIWPMGILGLFIYPYTGEFVIECVLLCNRDARVRAGREEEGGGRRGEGRP
jgi:hypothetical protein